MSEYSVLMTSDIYTPLLYYHNFRQFDLPGRRSQR